jgi:hypothetical protein
METGGSVWESNPNGILKTPFIDQHTLRNIADEVPRRCLDKFFFGKCSDKFAVFVSNSTAVLGTGLFLSASPRSRILFPIP